MAILDIGDINGCFVLCKAGSGGARMNRKQLENIEKRVELEKKIAADSQKKDRQNSNSQRIPEGRRDVLRRRDVAER